MRSCTPSLKFGEVKVLPLRIEAVGKSCRIMFIRARYEVITSFSWPSRVISLPASTTPFSGQMPTEILYSLPEWSMNIELQEDYAYGVWATLEYDVNDY